MSGVRPLLFAKFSDCWTGAPSWIALTMPYTMAERRSRWCSHRLFGQAPKTGVSKIAETGYFWLDGFLWG